MRQFGRIKTKSKFCSGFDDFCTATHQASSTCQCSVLLAVYSQLEWVQRHVVRRPFGRIESGYKSWIDETCLRGRLSSQCSKVRATPPGWIDSNVVWCAATAMMNAARLQFFSQTTRPFIKLRPLASCTCQLSGPLRPGWIESNSMWWAMIRAARLHLSRLRPVCAWTHGERIQLLDR